MQSTNSEYGSLYLVVCHVMSHKWFHVMSHKWFHVMSHKWFPDTKQLVLYSETPEINANSSAGLHYFSIGSSLMDNLHLCI